MGQTLAATAQERFSEPKTKNFLSLAASESVDPEARSPNQNHVSTVQLLALIKREGNCGFVALFINSSAEKGTAYLGAGNRQGALQYPPLYLIKEEPGLAYCQ